MNKYRIPTLLIAVFVVTAALAPALAGTAVAYEPDEGDGYNPVDDWLHGDDGETENESNIEQLKNSVPDWMTNTIAGASGVKDRLMSDFKGAMPWADDPPTNAESARAWMQAVNENSQTFQTELNNRTSVSSVYDTHAVMFRHEDSENVTVYVLADTVSTENGTSTEVRNLRVVNASTFEEEYPDRTVDEHWAVYDDAATNLPEETATIAKRIRNDDTLGSAYQAKLGGRYCEAGSPLKGDTLSLKNCQVRSTLWMDKEDI